MVGTRMNDNNRNLILATALSFLVIVIWFALFAPEPPPEPESAPETAATEPVETTGSPAVPVGGELDDAVPPSQDTAAATGSTDPSASAARVPITTSSLRGSISLAGGRLDDLLLIDYHETLDKESPHVRLLSPTSGAIKDNGQPEGTPDAQVDLSEVQPYYAVYGWVPGPGTDPAQVPSPSTIWSVESGTELAPGEPVTLVWENDTGQTFRRVFEIDDKYLFTVTQSVENNGDSAFSAAPYGIVARYGRPEGNSYYLLHEGSVGRADGTLIENKYKAITKFNEMGAEGPAEQYQVDENGWTGFTDKYWMTVLAPAPGTSFTAVVKYVPGADLFQTEARMPMVTVEPGASTEVPGYLFAGAKVVDVLQAYQADPGLQGFVDAIDWGWFFFLTKPIFHVLHWLHSFIGNMGWSIIALTFVLKLLVFPLARKSYISMARMKELQPELEKLKETAGDDRMKYQQDMMALYKKQKVNPAAGCLPVLLQIPIFFSLYKTIFVTIELRHAPWLGWIRDLSAPDPSSILNLFGLLPWATPATGSMLHILSLPALAIILGISMWLQQKLNPTPADPTQKMIFAWMPWVFMFMLGGFASGLVLYWITNNTITIVQQYTIMSMHGHRPDLFGNIRASLSRKREPDRSGK